MNIRTAVRHTQENLRTVGVVETARWMLRRLRVRLLEWKYGIRTDGVIRMRELGIESDEALEYWATSYSDFPKIMRALNLVPSQHVFVDFGVGLGRVVILAATYPFRRVSGVEHSPELAKQALANIAHSRPRLKCQEIEVVTCDASSYVLPRDASVLFFNNPFQGQVLESVLRNIRNFAAVAHRPLLIACNVPGPRAPGSPFESQIREHEWLELKREFPLSGLRRCLIFQTRTAGG